MAGPAKVYNSERLGMQAVIAGEVVAGDVVIVRYEGSVSLLPMPPEQELPSGMTSCWSMCSVPRV